ncbi:hypothetical protein SAMN03159496_05731 [Rhizobium sp. NFR07]|uniref:hypothetical protein n=1 Tax=Rhizobium sp. NFR07 TaxID=1566262 RepID=UPI0008E9BE3B|nr:hypothetical protein [Rhizobium sp. NFR07]SFB60867.1 hypothetical protein SAMN03159496_05731 [Rhizobium sp. NFR07]
MSAPKDTDFSEGSRETVDKELRQQEGSDKRQPDQEKSLAIKARAASRWTLTTRLEISCMFGERIGRPIGWAMFFAVASVA